MLEQKNETANVSFFLLYGKFKEVRLQKVGVVRLGNAEAHIFVKNTKRVVKTLKNLKILKYEGKRGCI
jgi:hypothetical protein